MKYINTYIIEKLHINKDTKIVSKEYEVDHIIEIIEKCCNKLGYDSSSYRLSMINNMTQKIIVSEKNKCGALSLSFKKSIREEIEKNKPFKTFLLDLKKLLKKELKDKVILISRNNLDNKLLSIKIEL